MTTARELQWNGHTSVLLRYDCLKRLKVLKDA